MKFDPQLKDAISEIEAVLKKYDLGGFVSLVSKTHGEFEMFFPSWSAIQFEGKNLRMRCKKEERDKAEVSVHLLTSMMHTMGHAQKGLDLLFAELEKHLQIDVQSFRPERTK